MALKKEKDRFFKFWYLLVVLTFENVLSQSIHEFYLLVLDQKDGVREQVEHALILLVLVNLQFNLLRVQRAKPVDTEQEEEVEAEKRNNSEGYEISYDRVCLIVEIVGSDESIYEQHSSFQGKGEDENLSLKA